MTPTEAVIAERRRRGWSVRTAAVAGGISNTTWGTFERTGIVTPSVHQAVAVAFEWSDTWHENPPVVEASPQVADLTERMAALEAKVDQLLTALQPDTAPVAPVTPLRRAASGATGPRTEPGRRVSRPQPAADDGDHLE